RRAPRSQFDHRTRSDVGQPAGYVLMQQRQLGAGRVVLWQGGDGLEELRSALVVQQLGGKALLRGCKVLADLGEQATAIVVQGVLRASLPRASRRPVNCHVASGGKKLR